MKILLEGEKFCLERKETSRSCGNHNCLRKDKNERFCSDGVKLKNPFLKEMFTRATFSSPLWDLIAIADNTSLWCLDFLDNPFIRKHVERLTNVEYDKIIENHHHDVLAKTMKQVNAYFHWELQVFDLPLFPEWTEFQKKAWKALRDIPFGETRSYGQQAQMIGNPKAVRAIGGANHNNPIILIIPCHRVIGANGELTGYWCGLVRKKWLLDHEIRYSKKMRT